MALIAQQSDIVSNPAVQAIIAYLVEHPEQTAGAAGALAVTAFNYYKTGNVPIGRIPWRHLREMFGDLGDKYFGTDRPRGVPGIIVNAPPEEAMRALLGRHYENVDLYSYEYEDEAWGLRRPSGLRTHEKSGRKVPMETHPRGFRTDDDRTLVISHDEASRLGATGEHLAETMLSWERGRDIVSEDYDEEDIGYEEVESEADAGVTVVAPQNTSS